jgi:hypothetical protein
MKPDALRQIRERTGLPISEALKRGLRSLQREIAELPKPTAWEIYKQLDIGPGGYAIAPARDYKRALREKLSGVAPEAQGSVDVEASGSHGQELEGFSQ